LGAVGDDAGWRFGPYEFLAGPDRVMRGRVPIALTETEVKLLRLLILGAGEIIPRETLFETVWSARMTEDHTLTVNIWRLREEFGRDIIPPSERGGYRLGCPVERIGTAAEHRALALCEIFIEAEEKRQRMPDPDWDLAYLAYTEELRAALDWAFAAPGRKHIAIRLAGVSGRIWQRLPALPEGRRYLDRAVELIDDDVRPADAARALYHAGILIRETDRPRSLALFEQAAKLYRKLNDKYKLGNLLGLIGGTQLFLGRHDEARVSLLEAEKLLKISDQSKALWNVYNDLGSLAYMLKLPSEAIEYYGRARDIAQLLNDPVREHLVDLNLGELEFSAGALDRAIERASEAARGLRTAPSAYRLGAFVNLAIYQAIAGDRRKATKAASDALPLAAEQGGHWLRLCLQVWAFIAAESGLTVEAARLAGFVDAQFDKIGAIRDASDRGLHKLLTDRLAANFTPDSLDVWRREGAAWREPQAVQWVKDRIAFPVKSRARRSG
jgi:DNA-binding winged helix-turn-helix (wHTH) protein